MGCFGGDQNRVGKKGCLRHAGRLLARKAHSRMIPKTKNGCGQCKNCCCGVGWDKAIASLLESKKLSQQGVKGR